MGRDAGGGLVSAQQTSVRISLVQGLNRIFRGGTGRSGGLQPIPSQPAIVHEGSGQLVSQGELQER